MKKRLMMSSALLLMLLLLFFETSDALNSFIFQIKQKEQDSIAVFANVQVQDNEQLRNRIKGEAEKLRIEPVNAKVDRIWKAIPGYNGLEVDLEQTIKLALAQPAESPLQFVYKEIEPEVVLADLPTNPIYRGNPNKKMVSFMINVAWGNEYIPGILKVLREENVKTTFFLDGSWLKRNKTIAEIILKEGHELSNHAYSHKNMSRLKNADAVEEIRKTELLLQELGIQNHLFAPPSGDFDQDTVNIAKQQGLYTILWTLDTVDWRKPTPESVIRKITAGLEPGALILMHPTEASSKALTAMIKNAKSKGYAVSTVSDLISEKRVNVVEQRIDF